MSILGSSTRRGIAGVSLVCVLALSSTACGLLGGNSSESDSDACGSGSGGGNVTTCFGISDISSDKGDAVIPAGTSVNIVCKDGDNVGIIIPKGVVNSNLDNAEWATKNGVLATRGISTDYFSSVPTGLKSCDSVLQQR